MSGLHPKRSNRSLTSLCLLAAVAMPIIYFGTQIVAAPEEVQDSEDVQWGGEAEEESVLPDAHRQEEEDGI